MFSFPKSRSSGTHIFTAASIFQGVIDPIIVIPAACHFLGQLIFLCCTQLYSLIFNLKKSLNGLFTRTRWLLFLKFLHSICVHFDSCHICEKMKKKTWAAKKRTKSLMHTSIMGRSERFLHFHFPQKWQKNSAYKLLIILPLIYKKNLQTHNQVIVNEWRIHFSDNKSENRYDVKICNHFHLSKASF